MDYIKKFHSNENIIFTQKSTNSANIKLNNLCCKYCNKEMSRSNNLKRHEKTCVNKKDIIEELTKKTHELNEIKKLIKTNSKSKNIINCNIIKFDEEPMKLLSEEQKLKVLNSINGGKYPIVTLVEELFKNEKNRNIKISNLHDNIALKYDSDIKKFKATSKKQVINDIISVRKYDITKVFEEFCNTNKINDTTKASIEKYLIKLHNSSEKNSELKKFMNEHKEQIIFIIYNITLTE